MQIFNECLMSRLACTQNEEEAFDSLLAAAQSLGFEHCAYSLKLPLPMTNPKVIIRNNYPMMWQNRYQQAGYASIDPTVRHCLRTTDPLIWKDSVFSSTKSFWLEAQQNGLCVGWAQSSSDAIGVGMFTLSRSREALTNTELRSKEVQMRWLVHAGHVVLSRLMKAKAIQSVDASLTAREIEVLKWTADGKTASEIGEILCISIHTVKFHTKNSIVKLKVANKTAAVVQALFLGLLN